VSPRIARSRGRGVWPSRRIEAECRELEPAGVQFLPFSRIRRGRVGPPRSAWAPRTPPLSSVQYGMPDTENPRASRDLFSSPSRSMRCADQVEAVSAASRRTHCGQHETPVGWSGGALALVHGLGFHQGVSVQHARAGTQRGGFMWVWLVVTCELILVKGLRRSRARWRHPPGVDADSEQRRVHLRPVHGPRAGTGRHHRK